MNTRRKHKSRKSSKSEAVEFLEKIAGGPLTFGRMLHSLRECDDVTQSELARRLGVSRAHICNIEKGRKHVSPAGAARIARELGYDEEFFVRIALQNQLDNADLHMKVSIEAA